jgi:hypothetical protein
MADYVKFNVTNIKDKASGAYAPDDFDRDLNRLRRAIRSALPDNVSFSESEKAVSKQGRLSKSLYIPEEYATLVNRTIKSLGEKLVYSGGDEKYKITRARSLNERDQDFLKAEEQKRQDKGKNEDKEKTASAMFSKASWLKVIALLLSIGDTVKRIFSAVLDLSTKTLKDMQTAHNLGISYEEARKNRYVETAHGLKEGTINDALSDVQNKFGNITKLDESALNDLAIVMGGKVEEMVKLGLGASDPEKILASILDTFNEKANSGYNSVGQYVGEQQARRELYSYLLKISPTWADIFATMQEEQHNINSIFRDQVSTWEGLKNASPVNRDFGKNQVDRNVTATLGQEWNLVRAEIQQVKDAILTSLAPQLLSILRWIENWRFGLSEAENKRLNTKNRALNQAEIERVSSLISEMEENKDTLNVAERAYLVELKEYKDTLEDANKGDSNHNIKNVTRTSEEIRQEAMNDIRTIMDKPDNWVMAYLGDKWFEIGLTKTGFNEAGVRQVAEDYNMDLNPFIKKYANKIEKDNEAKVASYNKEIETETENIYEANRKNMLKETGKADKASVRPQKKWQAQLDFIQKKLGNSAPAWLKDDKLSLKDKYDKAKKEGYLYNTDPHPEVSSNWTINPDKFIPSIDEIRGQVKQSTPVPKLNSTDFQDFQNDVAFWKSVYDKDPYFYDAHMNLGKLDELMQLSETGNRWSSIDLANAEIQNIAKSFGIGASGYITSSNSNEGGETVHKVVLTIKDAKGRTENFDFKYKGKVDYEGVTNIYVDETGDVHYQSTDMTAGIGTPASGQK